MFFVPFSFNVVVLNTIPPLTFYAAGIIPLFLFALWRENFTVRFTLMDLLVALFALWVLYAVYSNDGIQYGLLAFLDKFIHCVIPYYLVRLIVKREDVLRFLLTIAVCMSVLGLLSPFEFVLNLKWPQLLQYFWPAPALWAPFKRGFYRVFSTFGHPIHAGMCFSVAFFIAFTAYRLKAVKDQRKLFLMMFLNAVGIYTTISRISYLLAVPIVLFINFIFIKRKFAYGAGLTVVFLAIILLLMPMIQEYSNPENADYNNEQQTSVTYRVTLMDSYYAFISARPLVGYGHQVPVANQQSSIDNYFLLLAMQYGVPGFAIFAAALLLTLAKGITFQFRSSAPQRLKTLAWALSGLMLYYAITSYTVWLTVQPRVLVFMLFGLMQVLTVPPRPLKHPVARFARTM
jgi:hypothetical protein